MVHRGFQKTITTDLNHVDIAMIMAFLQDGKNIKAVKCIKDRLNISLPMCIAIKDEISRAMNILKLN